MVFQYLVGFFEGNNRGFKLSVMILVLGSIGLAFSVHGYFMRRDRNLLEKRIGERVAQGGGDPPSGGSGTVTEIEPAPSGSTDPARWSKTYQLIWEWLNDPDCKWEARGFSILVCIHWCLR